MIPALAERLADAATARGARAVALVGSHATGEAGEGSDLDLAVVGNGPRYRLEAHDGVLVSISWATAEEQRRRLYDPAVLGTHVVGWRTAVALRDPEGLAAALRQEASSWTWDTVAPACDTWVAETLVGYAEEAQKLGAALRRGDTSFAGVQRAVLALRLPPPLAIRHRILYGSDRLLGALLGEALGGEWRAAHAAALALAGESLAESCRAALRLFELAVEDLRPLLDGRQSAVVDCALEAGR